MDDIRKFQIIEEIENLTKDIKSIVIEKNHSMNMYNQKLKSHYVKLDKLYTELKRLIPIEAES